MSDGLHPFWKADDTPDSKTTAITAIVFFLVLAVVLLAFVPTFVGAFLAALNVSNAIRTWRRFRSHTAKR